MDKVRVAVRVRPINRRELELETECIVDMVDKQTFLAKPVRTNSSRRRTNAQNESADESTLRGVKTFAFDECFDSKDAKSSNYASQEEVYDKIGKDITANAFEGYNGCIVAYGQTGSGKSYTMMGTDADRGLIPRLAEDLFKQIAESSDSSKVEVSYMEIYNERVHDLLDPYGHHQALKVREHQILGPYVDGLSKAAVTSYEDVEMLIQEGNRSRTIAATNMNSESSRSHAVFTIVLTTTLIDHESGTSGERVARISLVDLAGSERASKSGAVGERLREGSNINKSLTTLGLVISKLADQGKSKDGFVPYRDSVLTWLLKDNLGGNSKTVMIATLSPAGDNFEETLSTLRYADRAKRIVNHAKVNEDPRARIIRELRAEVEALRKKLQDAQVGRQQHDLEEKLTESKKLMEEYSETWEEKLAKSEKMQIDRHRALERQGLVGAPLSDLESAEESGPPSLTSLSVRNAGSGLKVSKELFSLVNLNADPSLDGVLLYYLKDKTLVGRREAATRQDIELSGLGIQAEHCIITIEETLQNGIPNRSLFIEPCKGARTCINGKQIHQKTQLEHRDRIIWGNHHFYRVNCPVRSDGMESLEVAVPEPGEGGECLDYDYARRELERNEMKEDPIQLAISKLEKQHKEDKQAALQKQREDFERQMQNLKNIISPNGTQGMSPLMTTSLRGSTYNLSMMKLDKWSNDRDERFKHGLAILKEKIYEARGRVREANYMAQEMALNTTFKLTLRIPIESLTPYGTKKGGLMSEPAVLVKRKAKQAQVWSVEKLDHKLVDMREAYEEFQRLNQPLAVWREQSQSTPALLTTLSEPFWESQETHSLIGVANFFLEMLFQDVPLTYNVPIISQQGEVAGKLLVEMARVEGKMPDLESVEAGGSEDEDCDEDRGKTWRNQSIVIRVKILRATGLPLQLSNFVFCHYSLWGEDVVVPPIIPDAEQEDDTPESKFLARRRHGKGVLGSGRDESNLDPGAGASFYFDHCRDFCVGLNEEFIDHCIGAYNITESGGCQGGFQLKWRNYLGRQFEFVFIFIFYFLAYTEGALSIQVWGHRVPSHSSNSSSGSHPFDNAADVSKSVIAARSLQERYCFDIRIIQIMDKICPLAMTKDMDSPLPTLPEEWNEVRRQLEVWVGIQELNDEGEYVDVDVEPSRPDVITGGVYVLKQGLQRRLIVSVDTVPDSGLLPLVCDEITSVSIGNVVSRPASKTGLDSYQEEDLKLLRSRWAQLLHRRQKYLEKQMQDLVNKLDKSESEAEREQHLIGQWVTLTEEKNGIQVPSPGSNIPGAPVSPGYEPKIGLEKHIPVLFLDLNDFQGLESEDTGLGETDGTFAGLGAVIKHETWGPSIPVMIVSRHYSGAGLAGEEGRGFHNSARAEMGATCVWDSSIHESQNLNRVTPGDERVYMIVKVCVHLAHPVSMEIMLRKRICVQITKKNAGLTFSGLMKRFNRHEKLCRTGVRYEIVSNIPKASEELEDRETLAQMAAEEDDGFNSDGETYIGELLSSIKQYTKGLGVVENLLALDRLRQNLALKEQLQALGATPTSVSAAGAFNLMRKTVSVPNIAMVELEDRETLAQMAAEEDDGFNSDGETYIEQYTKGLGVVENLLALDRLRQNLALKEQLQALGATPTSVSAAGAFNLMRKTVSVPNIAMMGNLAEGATKSETVADFGALMNSSPSSTVTLRTSGASPSGITPKGQSATRPVSLFSPNFNLTKAGFADRVVIHNVGSWLNRSPFANGLGAESYGVMSPLSVGTMRMSTLHEEDHQRAASRTHREESEDSVSSNGYCEDSMEDPSVGKTVRAPSQVSSPVPPLSSSSSGYMSQQSLCTVQKSASTMDPLGIREFKVEDEPGDEEGRGPEEEEEAVEEDEEEAAAEVLIAGQCSANDVNLLSAMPVDGELSSGSCSSLADSLKIFSFYPAKKMEDPSVGKTVRAPSQVSSPVPPLSSSSSGYMSQQSLCTVQKSASTMDPLGIREFKVEDEPGDEEGRGPEEEEEVVEEDEEEAAAEVLIAGQRSANDVNLLSAMPVDGELSSGSCSSLAESLASSKDSGQSYGKKFEVGDRVRVRLTNSAGVVSFIGQTEFAKGEWVGVTLDSAQGKNDGTVAGTRYFECEPRHGLFLRADKLARGSCDERRKLREEAVNVRKTSSGRKSRYLSDRLRNS
ncbi:unnamed protein product [Notodromas monacha]|uniref:Kinesin motor domain-containing protein n=1 Tax=Notodromas monacha TaxID=399045 RepID=A0A7R9BD64_9CRUS|nr:unnamed protein product [Notodromas monacha]CAG0913138.1 unnamed protein product [Notodromas monacha]